MGKAILFEALFRFFVPENCSMYAQIRGGGYGLHNSGITHISADFLGMASLSPDGRRKLWAEDERRMGGKTLSGGLRQLVEKMEGKLNQCLNKIVS